MIIARTNEKLTIRIDRGHRPSVVFDEHSNHVQIYIPIDLSIIYQPITQDVGYGYSIKLQRMQQQYKIVVQHRNEKKPECVVFASHLAYEQEIKTIVKEVNTKISDMNIAGSNLEVHGVLRGNNLTFESTVGTLHVYAKITCTGSLHLHSQNIVLSTESLLCSDVFKAICRKVQIDGRVYPFDADSKMMVDLSCGLVHIGVDGSIGCSIESSNKTTRLKQVIASSMRLNISGDLANYGKIVSKENIDLIISGSLISLSDGSLDSAGRGYNALKKLRKIDGGNAYSPSSSVMHTAIQSQNANAVANLIEKGVDLNDRVQRSSTTKKNQTLRQSAIAEYKEARMKSERNSVREKITLINALFAAHDWKRGSISSLKIEAVVGRNCDDTAQFSANTLKLNIGGSATVEKDSIWSSTWVELDARSHVFLHGQSKTRSLIMHSNGTVVTTSDAILSAEMFARIQCSKFECDGMWCTGESLAIDAVGGVQFTRSSYVESEKLEIECGGGCDVDGTWQLTSCWTHVTTMLIIQHNAKLFIEDCANISAFGFNFNGFLHATNKLDVILQDSAHFSGMSRLEAHTFNLTCKGFCTMGGAIVVNDLVVYVRNDLIATCSAKIMVTHDGDITTGSFRNDALWQVEKNLKMITGFIEQSEDGTLFVKYSMNINVHDDSLECFGGRLISSEINIKSLKRAVFDGLVRCNEMQVSLPYVSESEMTLKGQVDIVAGSLTVHGNLKTDEHHDIKDPIAPGLIISCALTAVSIVAPFASIYITEQSIVRLSGLKSKSADEFSILINAGALSTAKESSVLSFADSSSLLLGDTPRACVVKSEAIVCATTFHHRGQIKFSGREVTIISPIYVHDGRLTNLDNKQNHVTNLLIHVGELLRNDGIIACGVLDIIGDGILENTNRICAVDSMDIKLRNFNNDQGLIESKNAMKLLAVSKEWTKIGGSIKAKKPVDICANRLNIAIRNVQNLSCDKRLSFSATTDLLISSDVVDESKELSVGCAARQTVSVDCEMQLDRLEVHLGSEGTSKETVLFTVHQKANVLANTIIVSSKCEHLQMIVDGRIQCNRLRFTGNIKCVTVVGSGCLESVNIGALNCRLAFEMYNIVRVDDIQCATFDVLKENILRLEACDGEETTSIIADDLKIEGTLFLGKKLFIKSREGTIRLDGSIFGSSPDSEIACESSKAIIKGQLGTFKFAEIYARDSISVQNEKIRNIEKLCIECGDLSMYDAEIEACRNISINCDSLTSSGYVQGELDGESTMVIHATNIHSKMDITNMGRISIACKRSTAVQGKVENVKQMDIDSKWLNMSCDIQNVGDIKLSAWAICNTRQIYANKISITALSAFINNSAVLADASCEIVASFVLSMNRHSAINSDAIDIHSLCLCTRNDLNVNGINYLWLSFDPLTKTMGLTNAEMSSLKLTTTLLADRWMATSLDAGEILIGLKYISDLKPLKVALSTENGAYESFVELSSRFDETPVSLFNSGEFVRIIQSTKSLLSVLHDSTNGVKNKKKHSNLANSGKLYEGLVQFKNVKYCNESNESSDTDIGYVSRSSSEDLNSKASPRSTESVANEASSSFFSAEHLDNIEEKVTRAEEEMENEMPLDHIAYVMKEEEELAEFEDLEDELEMAEEGIIRTDYVVCREKNIYLAKLREKIRQASAPRPKLNIPIQRIPSSNDLVMKKLQVKHAISTLDLRSFGSQSSLASIEFGTMPDFGSPLQFSQSSPFQRSKIPLGSFRNVFVNRKIGLAAGETLPNNPKKQNHESHFLNSRAMLDSLIASSTAYNGTLCYNVSRGHAITITCDYPIMYYIENILYRSFFGCFYDLVEILLLSALWFCNLWIERDFTEAFLSCVALPLTASTALKIATFAWDLLFPRDFEKAWLIDMLYSSAVTSSFMTLICGLPIFLYMAIRVGTTRKQNYDVCTWIPYFLIVLLSFPLSAIFNIFYRTPSMQPILVAIIAAVIVSFLAMFVFIAMGCIAFACCSQINKRIDMLDPVVYDARSRLGWSMLYALVVPIPCVGSLYCFVSLAYFLDTTNYYEMLSNEMSIRTWFFFFGPLVLLITFLILPTYRDTILCGCRNRQFKTRMLMNQLPPAPSPNTPFHVTKTEVTPVIPLKEVVEKDKKSDSIFTISENEKKAYPVQSLKPAAIK
ncbi:unnamed protein product [Caenorhabditis bovis]|uniref:Uncharacterized protein n=1 Tax=Caenorhabditis bovis TaxID=2654633 RepID=A0A8S1EGF7_9PELO|nr:unnamed protein product [Caenorhabditis bovis]